MIFASLVASLLARYRAARTDSVDRDLDSLDDRDVRGAARSTTKR